DNYFTMLQQYAIPKIASLGLLDNCLFQQDGSPAHYSRSVIDFLYNIFKGRWMGKLNIAAITWPAC
ncbi:uncharacterized protein TRIADDRAFT_33264, partial [Trichoplax adhaerens]